MALPQIERSLLARIAFFLCHDGLIPEAEAVFSSLAESDPEKDGPTVGLALCNIVKGDCETAIALLDKRLAGGGSPIASSLRLYKLLALGMAGRIPEAKSLRELMRADGADKDIESADLLLAELEKRNAS